MVATGPPGGRGDGRSGGASRSSQAAPVAGASSEAARWAGKRPLPGGISSLPLRGRLACVVCRRAAIAAGFRKALKGKSPTCLVYHGFPSGVQSALLPEAIHGNS
jgi:hypothetical protein